MRIPLVRPGCGDCANCRYLKYLRPDIVTALIAPDFRERTLKSWDQIQNQHPCLSEREPAVSVQPEKKAEVR